MNDWRPFVYGGGASIVAELGTFPIDLTKTRLQIQGQKIDSRFTQLRYRGMSHALVSIAKEEGVRGLYSGISPAVLRQATYGTIKIGLYYSIKKIILSDNREENLMTNLLCGIFSGCIASAMANPTDVLKVRMQASSTAVDKHMIGAFIDIYKHEGIRGLWRGVIPTAQRAAVVAGVELSIYDICKKHFLSSGYFSDNVYTHFLSSFIAGFAGAVASNPIDVVKSRMMNQKKLKSIDLSSEVSGVIKESPNIYKNSMDCLVQTVKTEGLIALYKGFIPTWLRLGPWNVLFFVSYEQFKNLY